MTSVKNSDNVFKYRIKNKLKMSLKTIFNTNVEPQKKVRLSYKKNQCIVFKVAAVKCCLPYGSVRNKVTKRYKCFTLQLALGVLKH